MAVTVGLLVTCEAKPGKESDIEEFLHAGRSLVGAEPATVAWFAIKLGPTTYGIVDFFPDDAGRTAHLRGEVGKALTARADELFAKPPDIQQLGPIGRLLEAIAGSPGSSSATHRAGSRVIRDGVTTSVARPRPGRQPRAGTTV